MEIPSINIFIGKREEAIHGVVGTTYSKRTPGKFLHVYIDIKEDKPVFVGKIENVEVETSGPISREEVLVVINGLAMECMGRTREASEFYLDHPEKWN